VVRYQAALRPDMNYYHNITFWLGKKMLDLFLPETDSASLWRISQRHLELLEACPRKFQRAFLDRTIAPPSPESQAALEAGSRFHLLMQQRELGLPIETLLEFDPQLRQWVDTLLDTAPELFAPNGQRFRQAEHERTCSLLGFLLNVRYDLLIADESQAQILDWKTYPRPPQQRKLGESWQTRLYPYVLVETSQYVPEQVSMTYWFVRSSGDRSAPPEPQFHSFPYTADAHDRTRQDLTRLLTQLRHWLDDYQHSRTFPTTIERSGFCRICQRSGTHDTPGESLRERDAATPLEDLANLNLAEIPEISPNRA
jgi:PD-(D/E)XK nuclease superfamily